MGTDTAFNVWITDNGSWIKRLPKEDKDRSEAIPLSYNFSSSEFSLHCLYKQLTSHILYFKSNQCFKFI